MKLTIIGNINRYSEFPTLCMPLLPANLVGLIFQIHPNSENLASLLSTTALA